jgi:leucyl-tRNA synthetase
LLLPAAQRDDRVEVERLAMELPRVKAALEGQSLKRVIYVPGKLLNLVVS